MNITAINLRAIKDMQNRAMHEDDNSTIPPDIPIPQSSQPPPERMAIDTGNVPSLQNNKSFPGAQHHHQRQQQQQQQQSTTIGMPSPSKYLMSNKNLPKDVLIKIQELTKDAPHIRELHSSATPQERYNLENRIYNHFTQPRINFITELEDIITVNNINNYTKQEVIDWIPKRETSNRMYILLLLFFIYIY